MNCQHHSLPSADTVDHERPSLNPPRPCRPTFRRELAAYPIPDCSTLRDDVRVEPVDIPVVAILGGKMGVVSTMASLLERPLYSYADVDRLTGLTPGTGKRWLEGYTRDHVFYPPVLRVEPVGDNVVTWGEMVEARLLAEFRDSRVALQRLRPAVIRLREEFGDYPLAQARPFLEVRGQELVLQIQEEVDLDPALRIVVVRNDQLLLDLPAQRFRDSVVEYRRGAAHIVRPVPRVPEVVMTATRSFGQPSINGVHTEVIVEEIRAGAAREDVAGLYDLGLGDVDAAIRFELIAAAHSA